MHSDIFASSTKYIGWQWRHFVYNSKRRHVRGTLTTLIVAVWRLKVICFCWIIRQLKNTIYK